MNVLIVRNDKLGDFITALPSFWAVKNYNPEYKVIALVAPLNKELAKSCPFIDEVIVDENNSAFELAKKIKKHKIDISITLFSNTKVALAQFLAGIKTRVAPATKIAQIFYNKRVKQRRSQVKMAEFEYNLELLKSAFSDIDTTYPKPLCVFDDAKEVYKKFCEKFGITKKVIAFHVGYGGSSDANYSLDEYTEMIEAVLEKKDKDVVLTFGPDEKELFLTMRQKLLKVTNKLSCEVKSSIKVDDFGGVKPIIASEDCAKVVFYISDGGIVNFAKIISGFSLFVSTSTGTYHLASMVGTPTLTFFADTLFASAKRWKSIGDESKQTHYMLPQDLDKRKEILKEVKKRLASF